MLRVTESLSRTVLLVRGEGRGRGVGGEDIRERRIRRRNKEENQAEVTGSLSRTALRVKGEEPGRRTSGAGIRERRRQGKGNTEWYKRLAMEGNGKENI